MFKRLSAVALTATMLIISTGVTAEAGTTTRVVKKSEAEALYKKAASKSADFVTSKPFVFTVTDYYDGKVTDVDQLKVDSLGNSFENGMDSGSTFYIDGFIYASTKVAKFEDYEMEIINDLKLDINLPYAEINGKDLDSSYDSTYASETFRNGAKPDYTLISYTDPKYNKYEIKKSGSNTFITITQKKVKGVLGFEEVRLTTVNIVNGIIVSTSVKVGSKSLRTNVLKPFTGLIVKPAGPYLDWGKVYKDPRYNIGAAKQLAESDLRYILRGVQAVAAVNNRTDLTQADWIEGISQTKGTLYDKGVGFFVDPSESNPVEVCGVFNGNDAVLEMSSCTSLGFKVVN